MLKEASALFRAGDKAAALTAYKALLTDYPDLPNSWFNMAICQRDARNFDGALASYARALDLGISMPEEVHLQRAVIYADDLNLPGEARRELDAALACNAKYVPALLNIGSLYEDAGNWSAALETYEHVLGLDGSNALALSRRLLLCRPTGPDDAVILNAQKALLNAEEALDRADLGFAIGTALDRCGAYDGAFAAYAAANTISSRMAARAGLSYDSDRQERFIQRLTATPNSALTNDYRGRSPVFICGMFRSGSTLIEQILGRHPAVVAGGEMDLLPGLIRDHFDVYPEELATLPTEKLNKLRKIYLSEAARRAGDRQLTDKRPDNFLHIGLIKALFPKSRILHSVRNKNDNCLSIYFLHASAQLPYATDLSDINHFYGQYKSLMCHWQMLYADDIFDVDYDRLVAEPQETIREILRFCDLEWNEDVLHPERSTSAIRTASHWQVRQPLYTDSSGRWRNYRRHLAPYGLVDPAASAIART